MTVDTCDGSSERLTVTEKRTIMPRVGRSVWKTRNVPRLSEEDATVLAINKLEMQRCVIVEGKDVEIALLVHPEGQRPLVAPSWWSGKEVSIVGADVAGNFFLRQSGGSVGYWIHEEGRLAMVAASVRDFIASIH